MGNIYIGVNNIARKIKGVYVGVNGVARKVKQVYIGDANGKARLVWQSILKFVSKYVSISLGGTLFFKKDNSSYRSYSCSFSTSDGLLVKSDNLSNTIYAPMTISNTSINNSSEGSYEYYVCRLTYDDNNNITEIKKVNIGNGWYGVNYSGTYYSVTYPVDCLFEFGSYLFCSYAYISSSDSVTKAYYCLFDMNTETIVSKVETYIRYKRGFAFNDTYAVISTGGDFYLLTRNGTSLALGTQQRIRDSAGLAPTTTGEFSMCKMTSSTGIAMISVANNGGDIYACGFTLSNGSLILSTPQSTAINTYHRSFKLIPIDTNHAIFTAVKHTSDSAPYYNVYIPTIVNSSFQFTFGTTVSVEKFYNYTNKIASELSFGYFEFNTLYLYQYDPTTNSITYKGRFEPSITTTNTNYINDFVM